MLKGKKIGYIKIVVMKEIFFIVLEKEQKSLLKDLKSFLKFFKDFKGRFLRTTK